MWHYIFIRCYFDKEFLVSMNMNNPMSFHNVLAKMIVQFQFCIWHPKVYSDIAQYIYMDCVSVEYLYSNTSNAFLSLPWRLLTYIHKIFVCLFAFQKLWKRIWRSGKRIQNNNELMLLLYTWNFVLSFFFSSYTRCIYGYFIECSMFVYFMHSIQLHTRFHI